MFEELRNFGGHLECNTCGAVKPLGDPKARVQGEGWPKCCGYTMTWWTARLLAQAKAAAS
jgi:hypothetical protein